jgi:hypothetical protein
MCLLTSIEKIAQQKVSYHGACVQIFIRLEIPESKIKLRRVSGSSSIKHIIVAASMFKASNLSTVLNSSPSPPHGSESPQASKLLPPNAHILGKNGLIDDPFIDRCSHDL